WDIMLGDVSVRDPYETCGDAAMHVVVTELLLERCNELEDGLVVRKGIIAPLLSNSTFLHILASRGFYHVGQDTANVFQKYVGNASEVFAGAFAIFASLEKLKNWIKITFDPIIKAAIKA
ncbi:hypothetical protein DFH09DRAFT_870751, partial [Mycena vulgaris]